MDEGNHSTSDATGESAWLPGVKALHKELMAHALAWPFLEPVDPIKLNIPTYFQIIERPMDFGTMQAKLQGSSSAANEVEGDDGMAGAFGGSSVAINYTSLDEYKQDLFLVFRNAIKFNADDGREESVGYVHPYLCERNSMTDVACDLAISQNDCDSML
ncbi:hypothetical protein DYB28_011963 [Aphanomyces astaci]|uniref:Bromo domain-containing protein n=2 Tax=Aphanomyces astaci TaxID=112090 RepID=A0A9X8H3F4_APHAT|nr:hypothetical protein DYB28_011963 [Aphanomyces astaci]